MGMQLAGNGRRGRGGRRSSYRPLSEINVTPFVDVMLVLLIVFMVTAPLLKVGVPIDLPKVQAKALPDPKKEPLVISVTGEGDITISGGSSGVGGGTKVEITKLVPMMVALSSSNPDVPIYVRGDKGLAYGRIMEVMGAVNAAGFHKVALVAELPQGNADGLRKGR